MKDVSKLLEDVESLSLEDKLYLQDRNIRDFGLKITDVNPNALDPANPPPKSGDAPPEPTFDPEPQDDDDEVLVPSYDDMTNDQLADELKLRGLPTSGNKAELIARLVEDDEEPE